MRSIREKMSEGIEFGMQSSIASLVRAIASNRYHFAVMYQHATDWNLLRLQCFLRLLGSHSVRPS